MRANISANTLWRIEIMDGQENTRTEKAPTVAFLVMTMFGRAHTYAAAAAGAGTAAVAMLIATLILVVKGPSPGYELGANLAALSLFWPGYSVSWLGSLVGAAYASVLGAILGFFIALFWNFAHIIVVGAAMLNSDWLERE
jgi:hypothetical protein